MKNISLHSQLKERLNQPLPGKEAQEVMAPSSRNPKAINPKSLPRLSAVLLLLYPKDGKWYMPLTKRNTYQGQHSGQISFPGGKKETTDNNLRETALRETFEEIGVHVNKVNVLGKLTPLKIPISNFMVHPYMALLDKEPHFFADKHEVNHIIEFPVELLWKDEIIHEKTMISQGHTIIAPVFQLTDDYIWGATAMILSEFKYLLKDLNVINDIYPQNL